MNRNFIFQIFLVQFISLSVNVKVGVASSKYCCKSHTADFNWETEILRMTGEVKPQRPKQQINIFFLLQTTEYLPYYKHNCLDSEPSTFLLGNRYIIFKQIDKDIILHMIMILHW